MGCCHAAIHHKRCWIYIWHIKAYLHFIFVFNTDATQVVEILPCRRLGHHNPAWSIPWLLQWNSNQNEKLFIQENAFGTVACKMAAILSRGSWVNAHSLISLWPGKKNQIHLTQFPRIHLILLTTPETNITATFFQCFSTNHLTYLGLRVFIWSTWD